MSIAFVTRPGNVEIGRAGATITYESGGEVFVRQMPIEDFRAFISVSVQKLHEFDAAQRSRVVPFKKGAPRKH